MLLPLVLSPDPLLKQISLPVGRVDKELAQFGRELIETMIHEHGLGLSAVQVGKLINVICIMVKNKPILMYNPKILMTNKLKKPSNESCLSFPGESYKVKRPTEVKVQYTNITNKKEFLILTGIEAIAFLHEKDHCSGITFDTMGDKVK